MDLICNGFDGDETMFRVTKGISHTFTNWFKDGKSASHRWGAYNNTLISRSWERQRNKIVNFIKNDLRIRIE